MSSLQTEPSDAFLKLFQHEVQNRAFALRAVASMASEVAAPEDVSLYSAWRDFEEFNQRRYAPYAARYGFSQSPGWTARLKASVAKLAETILSERQVLRFMHKETKKYAAKLAKITEIAPQDDKDFYEYVVRQEYFQVSVLEARLDGDASEATRLLKAFILENDV